MTSQISLPRTWYVSEMPSLLYIEKIDGGYANIEMKYEHDGDSCQDNVRIAYHEIILNSVRFSGDEYKRIKQDTGSQDYYCNLSQPQWEDKSDPPDGDVEDSEDKQFPICFVSGSKMSATARWHYEGNGELDIYIKGEGPDGLNFPQKLASIDDDILVYPMSDCESSFADDEINFDNEFIINWKISFDGGSTWEEGGESSNQCYILRDQPQAELFHTVVHLSCDNAKGISDESVAVGLIWNEFVGKDVKRLDDVPLKYYGNWNVENITTADLLKHDDGQCNSWVELFFDMLRVHNLHGNFEKKNILPADSLYMGFIVNDFNFTNFGNSYLVGFTHINILYQGDGLYNFQELDEFDWAYEEVTDIAGISGQNNNNPLPVFNFHIVLFNSDNNSYYDPSYGVKYSSLQEIDDMISGFWGQHAQMFDESIWDTDFNKNGDKIDTLQLPSYHFIENPPGINIQLQ